jgi:hypothetical protein
VSSFLALFCNQSSLTLALTLEFKLVNSDLIQNAYLLKISSPHMHIIFIDIKIVYGFDIRGKLFNEGSQLRTRHAIYPDIP